MTIRILKASAKIYCCIVDISRKDRYTSEFKTFYVKQEKNIFYDSLREWRWNKNKILKEVIRHQGEDKCKALSGSLYLCGFEIINIELTEE